MSERPAEDDTQPCDEEEAFAQEVMAAPEPMALEDQVTILNGQLEEMRTSLQRVQADFVNYKRRADQEREEMLRHLNAGLITRLLPVLDDLGMALDHAPKAAEGKAWADGVGLVNRKLHSILESEGAAVIEAEGQEFDPSQHEALGFQESTEHQEGQIALVVRPGYVLNGRVLRPAQVIVARSPETA